MLFKLVHLKGIRSGTITLVFRRWKKAAVKKGSLLNTAVGLVKVESIVIVKENKITKTDAMMAGFDDREELLKLLQRKEEGEIYKIKVSFQGADPRIQLRQKNSLTNEEYHLLNEKLSRLDQYSKKGSWTLDVMTAIKNNPKLRAMDLAAITGFEKVWLKLNIRKLKNLGLTISHEIGYELSPLGKLYLKKATKKKT